MGMRIFDAKDSTFSLVIVLEGLLQTSLVLWTERLPAPLQVPSQRTLSVLVSTHSAVSLQCKPEHETRDILETGLKKQLIQTKMLTSTLTK